MGKRKENTKKEGMGKGGAIAKGTKKRLMKREK